MCHTHTCTCTYTYISYVAWNRIYVKINMNICIHTYMRTCIHTRGHQVPPAPSPACSAAPLLPRTRSTTASMACTLTMGMHGSLRIRSTKSLAAFRSHRSVFWYTITRSEGCLAVDFLLGWVFFRRFEHSQRIQRGSAVEFDKSRLVYYGNCLCPRNKVCFLEVLLIVSIPLYFRFWFLLDSNSKNFPVEGGDAHARHSK